MPGNANLSAAYNRLGTLLNTPPPGATSAGQDQASAAYTGSLDAGISDLASRGILQSGATPSLYTTAGEDYASNTAAVQTQATQAAQQRRLQLLNSILGLGGPALGSAKATIGADFGLADTGINIGAGAFGPGGLLSNGLTGNQGLLSELGFHP